jgi:hypothetical protein
MAASIAHRAVIEQTSGERVEAVKISLRLALPSSPSIAIARCSITARWAMLAANSGYWTGRF